MFKHIERQATASFEFYEDYCYEDCKFGSSTVWQFYGFDNFMVWQFYGLTIMAICHL